jgi:uncharacterized protein (TIGR02391 family)
MDKKRAIEILAMYVDEIPHLKTLRYGNDEFKLWLKKVADIITAGFEPEDQNKYQEASGFLRYIRYEDELKQQDYVDEITRYEIALKSIIQRYQILGIGGETGKGVEVKKIDINIALGQLERLLYEIPRLKKLLPKNSEFPNWDKNVKDIIKGTWGLNSKEYNGYDGVLLVKKINRDNQQAEMKQADLDTLEQREAAIKSIIKIYGKTEISNMPKEKPEITDNAISPIQLFDAVQFHPKVVKASKSCFITSNYREAILNAFITIIEYVKEKTALDLDGDDLMNQAFSFDYDKKQRKMTKYPIIYINELKNITERDEQQGMLFLCKGAVAFCRNPKAHKLAPQTNLLHTLEYLAFASLLIRRVEEGKVAIPKQPKINEKIFFERCNQNRHEKAVVLYTKAKALEEKRLIKGDFINWGVSGYSYRMPWNGCINGGTIFTALGNGKLQIWPDIILRKSSVTAGNKYLGKLRGIPSLARGLSSVSIHKYPTISTDRMSESDIDSFIVAIEELGDDLEKLEGVTS